MRNEAFLRLFAGSGSRALENGLELCVVPAYEVLQSRREAMDACGEDEQTLGQPGEDLGIRTAQGKLDATEGSLHVLAKVAVAGPAV